MEYSNWEDVPYLIDAGSLAEPMNSPYQTQTCHTERDVTIDDINTSYKNTLKEYRYKELLSKAFESYSNIRHSITKQDAAINFTTIGAIGLSLLCMDSFVLRLLFLIISVILSFEIELQIPAASIILAIFVFRDRKITLPKAALLIMSFVVIVYYYWSSMLTSYTVIIWWVNIIIVVLWLWLLFTGSNIDPSYYSLYNHNSNHNTNHNNLHSNHSNHTHSNLHNQYYEGGSVDNEILNLNEVDMNNMDNIDEY